MPTMLTHRIEWDERPYTITARCSDCPFFYRANIFDWTKKDRTVAGIEAVFDRAHDPDQRCVSASGQHRYHIVHAPSPTHLVCQACGDRRSR